MRDARRRLHDAREAHVEQRRAYEDLKEQRKEVGLEKDKRKKREKEFEEGERAAKLDGQGELDEMGELQLRQKSNDVHAERIAIEIERERAQSSVSKAEEVFQRLRRATHDPESIATPKDLIVTMLSAKERGEELQAQVDRVEEMQRVLTQDKQRLDNELQNLMYYGASQILDDAEREFEPKLEAAHALMEQRRKKCSAARALVQDSKVGLSLLTHLTLGDSIEKTATDNEIPMTLDRIERHLLFCLNAINQPQTQPTRVPRAAERVAVATAETSAASAAKGNAASASASVADEKAAADGVRAASATADGATTYSTPEGESAQPLVPHPPPYPKPNHRGRTDGTGASTFVTNCMLNNIRVFTQEELDYELDAAPEDEPEGVDDDGNELALTRRSNRAKRAAATGKQKKARKGARAIAPGSAAPLQ